MSRNSEVNYRGDSLAFLYSVMKGRIKDKEAIVSKSTGEVVVIKKPVTAEGRMKAAERILKYYTDTDAIESSSEPGIVILPECQIESFDISPSEDGQI